MDDDDDDFSRLCAAGPVKWHDGATSIGGPQAKTSPAHISAYQIAAWYKEIDMLRLLSAGEPRAVLLEIQLELREHLLRAHLSNCAEPAQEPAAVLWAKALSVHLCVLLKDDSPERVTEVSVVSTLACLSLQEHMMAIRSLAFWDGPTPSHGCTIA
jgi:hypothetical protein